MRDSNGLAEGGLRHVFVQVPVSYNAAMGCPLFGTYNQWSAAKIRSIYPSHAICLSNVSAWSTYEVQKGWCYQRTVLTSSAAAFIGPWTSGSTAPAQGL